MKTTTKNKKRLFLKNGRFYDEPNKNDRFY